MCIKICSINNDDSVFLASVKKIRSNHIYLPIWVYISPDYWKVFILKVRESDDSPVQELFAVMVHIHDGNWDHGSGSLFPGHMLAASQKVVVVTFNYRLGPLGIQIYDTGYYLNV